MFKRDDFRTFIIISIVCVICLVIGFVVSYKNNTDKLKNVTEYNIFFSNVNYINNYINMIASRNNQVIDKILDDKYIKNNNIILNDYDYTDFTIFEANTMFYVEVRKNVLYYIKGSIYDVNHDGRELINDNFSILLINDLSTNSYSLYPVDDNNYESVINGIWNINIKRNEYNKYNKTDDISIEQMCTIYLSDFINNNFDGFSDSYELLSDNMKKIYSNKNSYDSFMYQNFGLMSSNADKCKMEEIDDKRIYTVIDSNGNKYIFNEESVMNYKVDFYLKEVS